MTISKRMVIPMAALAVVAAGFVGLSKASAAADSTKKSLAQDIADTFHLDKSKVQAVFDQHKADRQADHEARYEDRLSRAVSDGKLTAEQKSALMTEHQALRTKLDAAMQTTGDDRHTALEAVRAEAQQWAKDHNLDAKWLMMGAGGMGRRDGGHPGGHMMEPGTFAAE